MLPKINSYNDTPDDDLDVLAEFISHSENDYGSGMDNLSIAYMNRELAIQGRCSFIDPYYVAGNASRLYSQLVGQKNNQYLVTSSIQVYGDNNAPNKNLDNLFVNTLEAIHNLDVLYDIKFDKIFIPIGCQENNKIGHNIALILENHNGEYRATVLDQLGLDGYKKTKLKMIKQMESLGLRDIDVNLSSLTVDNRMDCVSVVSLLRDHTLDGEDIRVLKDLFDSDKKPVKFTEEAVNKQHKKDQDIVYNSCIRLATDIIKRDAEAIVALKGIGGLDTPESKVRSYVRHHMNNKNNHYTKTKYRER